MDPLTAALMMQMNPAETPFVQNLMNTLGPEQGGAMMQAGGGGGLNSAMLMNALSGGMEGVAPPQPQRAQVRPGPQPPANILQQMMPTLFGAT